MEVKKVHEDYFIKGKDSEGLIPKGTEAVLIDYNDDGSVKYIFYNSTKVSQEKLEEMNSRRQTQEEMNKVAGLLKKLSKF